MTQNTEQKLSGFENLSISPVLQDALAKLNFSQPTPIQQKAIPLGIEGKDVIGIAQTGTGKTLAFGLPLIQYLMHNPGKGLVIAPTRELALQIDETLQKIARQLGLKTAVLIGGASMYQQVQSLRRDPHVVIATPGRLIDHTEQKTISLADVKMIVLDEADRMLDIGFGPQIKRILQLVPAQRQTMLFSATMPQEIAQIANKYMKQPVRIEIATVGTTADNIIQEVFVVQKETKSQLLGKLLKEHPGTVLVFSRTKHGASKLCRSVQGMGHSSAEIHSNRSLSQRREALSGFKSGKYRVLVATDIAARGIDVRGIELVVNYDLPDNTNDYVHRIGRTGRAGQSGKAISFATPDQQRDIRDIERLIRRRLPITRAPIAPVLSPSLRPALTR